YNLQFAQAASTWGLKVADEPWRSPVKEQFSKLSETYAYGFSWQAWNAPKMLNYLLSNNIAARVAMKSFTAETAGLQH
ncbi:hypothetical protein CWC11_22200, partial [Pseudoalteromonas sp. S3178]|uniref:hypothetical protein n=1 Tax=Pseudoalteromonas sp. S3178 TaxID=579532 RepID=UPI00110A10D9